MRVRRKILCVRRSKLCRVASQRKVRTSSQPVSAMDQNSLICEGTVFVHGGRTGCARKSGEGGGGLWGAFASSRRLERICSLSRIRRPPAYFVRPASAVFRRGLPVVLATVPRLRVRPWSRPRDLRAVRLRRLHGDQQLHPRS